MRLTSTSISQSCTGCGLAVLVATVCVTLLSTPAAAELCTVDAVPAANRVLASHSPQIFADGFESGDLSAWTVRQGVPDSFRVTEAAAMFRRSLYGLEANALGNIFVQVKNPPAGDHKSEPVVSLGVLFDPHTLRIGDRQKVVILQLRSPTGRILVDLQVLNRNTDMFLRMRARNASGRLRSLGAAKVHRGQTNLVEVAWTAPDAGAANGGAALCVNERRVAHATDLPQGDEGVRRIRLGLMGGDVGGTTTGSVYYDSFESFRTLAP